VSASEPVADLVHVHVYSNAGSDALCGGEGEVGHLQADAREGEEG
jgi:hypothetical protein